MNQQSGYQQDLESIRKLMERSVKFISLSGMSGILSGVYALAGASVAAYLLDYSFSGEVYASVAQAGSSVIPKLFMVAVAVLVASISTGFYLTARKSKKVGAKMWDSTSKRFFINLAIPLVTGGLFILILLANGYAGLVAPMLLIFYGLALINASPNVYEEVRYLGYCEIACGLLAAIYPGFGLIFWAIGFGLLHIIYGSLMYSKYDA